MEDWDDDNSSGPKWRQKLSPGNRKQADGMLSNLFRMMDKVLNDVQDDELRDFDQCAVQLLAGTHMMHSMVKDICKHIGIENIAELSDALLSTNTPVEDVFETLPDEIKKQVRDAMAKEGVSPDDPDVQISLMRIKTAKTSPATTETEDDAFPFNVDTTGRTN